MRTEPGGRPGVLQQNHMAFWRTRFRVSTEGRATALLLAFILAGFACAPIEAAESLYSVAKISVDVTAKDAVAARDTGMAQSEQRAVMTVLKRIMPASASSLPEISKDDIDAMVSGV